MGLAERCACGQPADYRLEHRDLDPPRKIKVGETTKTVQSFRTTYRCETCARAELTGDDPPRSATALPHHAAAQQRVAVDARKDLLGDVEEQRLGDDWGRCG